MSKEDVQFVVMLALSLVAVAIGVLAIVLAAIAL
jgi:hypothetical protein